MNKEEIKQVTYPAPYLAHWVTGAVSCCEKHCKDIVGLGKFMGSIVPVSKNTDPTSECANCITESNDK